MQKLRLWEENLIKSFGGDYLLYCSVITPWVRAAIGGKHH
jgi:hypothetical protein